MAKREQHPLFFSVEKQARFSAITDQGFEALKKLEDLQGFLPRVELNLDTSEIEDRLRLMIRLYCEGAAEVQKENNQSSGEQWAAIFSQEDEPHVEIVRELLTLYRQRLVAMTRLITRQVFYEAGLLLIPAVIGRITPGLGSPELNREKPSRKQLTEFLMNSYQETFPAEMLGDHRGGARAQDRIDADDKRKLATGYDETLPVAKAVLAECKRQKRGRPDISPAKLESEVYRSLEEAWSPEQLKRVVRPVLKLRGSIRRVERIVLEILRAEFQKEQGREIGIGTIRAAVSEGKRGGREGRKNRKS